MCGLVVQCLSLLFSFFYILVQAGKLGQVTNFTRVDGTAKHCVDQYMVLFCYCSLRVDLPSRAGYMLGFATHFLFPMFRSPIGR